MLNENGRSLYVGSFWFQIVFSDVGFQEEKYTTQTFEDDFTVGCESDYWRTLKIQQLEDRSALSL